MLAFFYCLVNLKDGNGGGLFIKTPFKIRTGLAPGVSMIIRWGIMPADEEILSNFRHAALRLATQATIPSFSIPVQRNTLIFSKSKRLYN
jgi:hypothetical protein